MVLLKLCICLSVWNIFPHLTCEIVQINQWFIRLAAFASHNTVLFWYMMIYCHFYWAYKRTFAIMTLAKSVGGLGVRFRPKTVHLLVCEAGSVLFFWRVAISTGFKKIKINIRPAKVEHLWDSFVGYYNTKVFFVSWRAASTYTSTGFDVFLSHFRFTFVYNPNKQKEQSRAIKWLFVLHWGVKNWPSSPPLPTIFPSICLHQQVLPPGSPLKKVVAAAALQLRLRDQVREGDLGSKETK